MSDNTRKKKAKKARPPKPFRKPIKEKRYRRKLAGRIFLQTDREFLASITTTDEDGRITLKRELTREETGRVKKLRKAARKNRRGPRVFRLAILGVLVAAVIVFSVVFRDRLIERGAESLLEGVFEAQVDFQAVRFRPFAGELSFDSLTIADVDQPMRNLFEMTSGSVRMDTWQLVNRKVLIDELVVEGLQIDTPRDSSGALPGSGRQEAGESPAEGETDGARARDLVETARDALPPISFAELGLPDTLDAQAFLQENLDALSTPVAVETLGGAASGFVERWESEILALQDELTAIAGDVTEFAATDFRSIRTVDAAMTVYDDATSLKAAASGITGRIESRYNALVAEATGILESARSLPGLVEDDYDALLARVPDVRTEGRDFIVGIVKRYLQSALGVWYDRILKAQDIYARIAEGAGDREPRLTGRSGTLFDFAAVERPRFLISEARLGVGAEGAERLSAVVTSVTSDPELVGSPTEIRYSQTGRAGMLDIEAALDGRSASDVPVSISVDVADSPLLISRGLEALNLDRVSGSLQLETGLRKLESGVIDGAVELTATGLEVAGSYSDNPLGEFVAELLQSTGVLEGQFAFLMRSRSDVEFSAAETNLDELVADAVRERIDAAVAAFRAELEVRVSGYLDPLIASLNERLNGVIEIETSAEELLALARDREAAAAELERLAQGAVTSIRDQLEAEARAAIDAAKAEAERRAQEALDAAEEEARRAAEEAARDAAGDAVDTIRNRLPFGGGQ